MKSHKWFFFILWSSKKSGALQKFPFHFQIFYDNLRLDGQYCLYTWLFIQLFFLGKYNQGFNNFPILLAHSVKHLAILSHGRIFHLFFFSGKLPTFISSSGAPKKRRGAKSFLLFSDFFCDIIRLDGKLAYMHDFLFNSFF